MTGFTFGNMQLDGDKAAASVTCVPGESPAAPVGRLGHWVSTAGSAVIDFSLLFKKETFYNEVRLRVF